jgi:hypothetical protein
MVKIKIGDCVPDFTLQSSTGENISLSQFLGKKNLFFSFIRGMKDLLAVKRLKHSEIIMKLSKKVMQK